jgi:hypothetical protein
MTPSLIALGAVLFAVGATVFESWLAELDFVKQREALHRATPLTASSAAWQVATRERKQ